MARQEFTIKQEVMVRWYGDVWQKRVVVTPAGRKVGYGWTEKYEAGVPFRGERAYVEVKAPGEIQDAWTRWVVNARNRILSMKDYEPIAEAQERQAIARVEQEETIERAREAAYLKHAGAINDIARESWVEGEADDFEQRIAEYLKQHFTLLA